MTDERCVVCRREPSRPGLRTCAKCPQLDLERKLALRAAGLCTLCREPYGGPHWLCDGCRAITRVKDATRREAEKREGRCHACRRRPATSGTRCAPCREKDRARDRRCRKNPDAPLRVLRCKRCGEAGHFAKTCSNPARRAA